MELDELSQATLASYQKKVGKGPLEKGSAQRYRDEARYGQDTVERNPTPFNKKMTAWFERKAGNREKGLERATTKWNKKNLGVKEEVMYTIEDLVASAVAQKPGDFEEAFNNLILDKIGTAVEDRKLFLAQTMFNPVEEEVEIEEEEEDIEEADLYDPVKGAYKQTAMGYAPIPKSAAGVPGKPGTQSGPAANANTTFESGGRKKKK